MFSLSTMVISRLTRPKYFGSKPKRCYSSISIGSQLSKRPRRVVFNVPGCDERKIQKALTLDLDVMVLDFEDGVALNQKPKARELVAQALAHSDFGRTERTIRMNAVHSGEESMDLAALLPVLNHVDSILIPKVESSADCQFVDAYLTKHKNDRTRLFACIETAKGLLNIQEICRASPRLDVLIFGSEDFCSDAGMTRTPSLEELLYPRSQIIINCAAFGLQSIDLVCIDYKNYEQLVKECKSGYALGFDGKQAIHPNQIPIIYENFKPPQETLDLARKIVHEYEAQLERGVGAFVIDGKVIDLPMIKWAHKIVRKVL